MLVPPAPAGSVEPPAAAGGSRWGAHAWDRDRWGERRGAGGGAGAPQEGATSTPAPQPQEEGAQQREYVLYMFSHPSHFNVYEGTFFRFEPVCTERMAWKRFPKPGVVQESISGSTVTSPYVKVTRMWGWVSDNLIGWTCHIASCFTFCHGGKRHDKDWCITKSQNVYIE